MDRKGQIEMGGIILIAMAAIIGTILLTASAQNIGDVTNTVDVANESLGAAAANDTAQYLTNWRSISDVVVYNATNATGGTTTGVPLLTSGNYTITNNVVNNGALAVEITPTDVYSIYASAWIISGTAQPTTYDPSGGGRAVAGLITIFFALAIAVVTLGPILRNKIIENM